MTETFRPVKNCGSALGSRTRQSSCARLAPIVRSRFIASTSAEASPWIVPTAVAKNVNSATSTIFGAGAEAEPDDHERRERDQRDRLRDHHQRVDAAAHRARPVDRDREHERADDGERDPEQRLLASSSTSPARGRRGRPRCSRTTSHGPGSERLAWTALATRSQTSTSTASSERRRPRRARRRRAARSWRPRQQRVRVERRRAAGERLIRWARGEDPLEAGVVGVGLGPPGAGAVEEVRRGRVAGRVDDLLRVRAPERRVVVGDQDPLGRRRMRAPRTRSPAASAFSARARIGPRAAMSLSLAT